MYRGRAVLSLCMHDFCDECALKREQIRQDEKQRWRIEESYWVCVCVTVYERKRDGGALPDLHSSYSLSLRDVVFSHVCVCVISHTHTVENDEQSNRVTVVSVHVCCWKTLRKSQKEADWNKKGCLGSNHTATDSTAGCNVLPLLSGKFFLWHGMKCVSGCGSVCVCVHNTHGRERAGRRRSIRGGWAVVQTDSEGLDGGKAAFVRSQPPQQLPPIWRTLCEKINPAHSKWMKHPIRPVGRSITCNDPAAPFSWIYILLKSTNSEHKDKLHPFPRALMENKCWKNSSPTFKVAYLWMSAAAAGWVLGLTHTITVIWKVRSSELPFVQIH